MNLETDLKSIEKRADRDLGVITWYLSKRCNFDCSYCTDRLHDRRSPLLSIEDAKIALGHFQSFPAKRLKLNLSGGEPFLHKFLPQFLQQLRDKLDKPLEVGATTNGSLPPSVYIDASKWLDSLTFSAHSEFFNSEKFLQTVLAIKGSGRAGFHLRVNLMMLPETMDEMDELRSRFIDAGVETVVRKVRKKESSAFYEYSRSELAYISGTFDDQLGEAPDVEVEISGASRPIQIAANRIVSEGGNQFWGWNCMAGGRHFTLWNDGKIYPCEPREGIQPIGDFFCRNFQWPVPKSMSCPMKRCVCLADILIPKWRGGGQIPPAARHDDLSF